MKWFLGRFYYAFCGLKDCMHDRSIFYQCIFGLIVLICGFVFHLNASEWRWILLCIILVIAGEIVNSCIENCVDYISLKKDPRAKKIKDMAAAFVFLIAIFAAVVGLMIFIPHLV